MTFDKFADPSFMKQRSPASHVIILWFWTGWTITPAYAQIVPDRTLETPSIVTPEDSIDRIGGGTIAGDNLFHSFEDFSIPSDRTAFFDNPIAIENILTRVTGNRLSTIEGLLRANGTANLFLINPNGILFGPNARLDIGGSFIASTADSIQFEDGSTFSAIDPQAPPLLTLSIPIGLQYGSTSRGEIRAIGSGGETFDSSALAPRLGADPEEIATAWQNLRDNLDDRPAGLEVAPDRTLALLGGDVTVEGTHLKAPGGRIEIGSTASGIVRVQPSGSGFTFAYEDTNVSGSIELTDGASIDTSGTSGGDIRIQGDRIRLDESSIAFVGSLGDVSGTGILVRGSQLEVAGNSLILAGSFDEGSSGSIGLGVETLTIRDGAKIGTLSLASADAGDIAAVAPNSAEIDNGSFLFTNSLGSGRGGNIFLETDRLGLTGGSVIEADNYSSGLGGNINIRATESAIVSGVSTEGRPSGISSNAFGLGNGGDVSISTGELTIAGGAFIAAGTFNSARGGTIEIQATDNVDLLGASATGQQPSALFANGFSTGDAGDIRIETRTLRVTDGASIDAGTFGSGRGGNLTLQAAESIEVRGTSGSSGSLINAGSAIETASFVPLIRQLFDETSFLPLTLEATGPGGTLNLETGSLSVVDGGTIAVTSEGAGDAGTLSLNARTIQLDRGRISASGAMTTTGSGGSIEIEAQTLQLRRGSGIATDTGNADGGNITIETETLAALENSDITANAEFGRGGQVTVSARGVFGTEFREALTPESDITATSQLGSEFSGTVTITTPEVDTSAGLESLDGETTDPRDRVIPGCGVVRGNSFIQTGNGGLPEDPTATIRGQTLWEDTRDFLEDSPADPEAVDTSDRNPNSSIPDSAISSLVEATGWVRHENGTVELVASHPTALPSGEFSLPCRELPPTRTNSTLPDSFDRL
ncbi:MAG: S-layer family protein [Cyanobacteriota bacterium]|nr:S-layer family protein [Cyanobacteriota bacterium]